MNYKSYFKLLIFFSFLLLLGSSCKKDFLNKGIPTNQLVTANFYQNETEIRAATAYLYSQPWFDFNYPFIYYVGDIMSGNAVTYTWNTSPTTFSTFSIASGDAGLKYGWSSLYNVIAQANTTINNIGSVAPDSLAAEKQQAIAEARFIRAFAYFNLVQLWGPIPIITDNNKVAANPLLHTIVVPDIYKFIINDLQFSVANLPATDQPGRVTSWSAKGMLAKVYLTKAGITGTRLQSDLDSAKYYAKDVADNSGLTLFEYGNPNSYSDLFLRTNMNNQEILFGLQLTQVSYASAWGNNNESQTYVEADANIDGVGGGGWDGMRVTADLYAAYTPGDVRRKPTLMKDGDKYPELVTTSNPNGYSMTDSSSAYIKKGIIGGPLANGGVAITTQRDGMPTYMLRIADLYLVYAEAILGTNATTSDPEALKYFNMVRSRAGLATVSSLDFPTLMNERRLELAFENQYWFDLKRLHDYNPALATSMIKAQHRNMFTWAPGDAGITETVVQANPAYFTLPYPEVDVTSDPNLTATPVNYY